MLNTIAVKNLTGSQINLTRVGLSVAGSATLTISTYAYEHEIKGDESLLALIQGNSAVFVIDSVELTKSESLRFLSINVAPPVIPIRILSDADVASLSGVPGATDGLTPVAGDSILLTNQITTSENGPWIIDASTWLRPPSFPPGSSISGAQFTVLEGTTYEETTWMCSSAEGADLVGTSNLFFFQKISAVAGGGPGNEAEGIYIGYFIGSDPQTGIHIDLLNISVV